MKRRTLVGLHLWKVRLDNTNVSLWVATRSRSAELAARKANAVVRRDYKHGVKVASVEHSGTVDA